jgi:ectoine hydroxylase-related dioxygenase (phytanoyl-CoA dioxygenase family)
VRPKLPHHELTTVPWHQDAFYYGGKEAGNLSFPILSIWIPLIDVNEKNGCLQYVAGSNKWGMSTELNQKLPSSNETSDEQIDITHELDEKCISLCI